MGRFRLEAATRIWEAVPNNVGWKMIYDVDDYCRVAEGIRSPDYHISILPAPPKLWDHAILAKEFDGVVNGSIIYGLEPMMQHVEALLSGDMAGATSVLTSGLHDLHSYVYCDFSRLHIRFKIATWLRGLIAHPFKRPPAPKPTEGEIRTLHGLLDATGLNTVDEAEVEETIDGLEQRDQRNAEVLN